MTTTHNFKNHNNITKKHLYQNIFTSHFKQLTIIFL
ncbi:hypothetical protein [Escherichia coli]